MVELKDKVQNALDESRMLILGSQVLIGFEYRSVFDSGFAHLSPVVQWIKIVALGLMLVVLVLLLSPGPYHQIVDNGEDTDVVHRYVTRVMEIALLPFALALGIDAFVAGDKLGGRLIGIITGIPALLIAIFFWYGLELIARKSHTDEEHKGRIMEKKQPTELKDKVKQVLTEARVVLPGSQALLGFQFATMLMDKFDTLPPSSKYIHFASLFLVTISVVLLMTPAAYHRLVERGEDTAHFHSFAGRTLVAAMVPLALGIAGDFLVVLRMISGSVMIGLAAATLFLVFAFGLWFGFTIYKREQKSRAEQTGRTIDFSSVPTGHLLSKNSTDL